MFDGSGAKVLSAGDGLGAGIESALLDFTAKRVLVTGAAGDIGGAIAAAFAAHGATVLLADRDHSRLLARHAEIPGSAWHLFDQTDAASVQQLAAWAGDVDVLMNNAGILRTGDVLDATPDEVQQVIQTNLIGPMQLAIAIANGMAARRQGVIVNTASQLAFTGAATRALYATAKAGVVQFTRSMASELGARGVRVVALAPGRTRTRLNAHLLDDEDEYRRSIERIPAGRIGNTQEMARLALILASRLSDYIVGESLIADGGYVLE